MINTTNEQAARIASGKPKHIVEWAAHIGTKLRAKGKNFQSFLLGRSIFSAVGLAEKELGLTRPAHLPPPLSRVTQPAAFPSASLPTMPAAAPDLATAQALILDLEAQLARLKPQAAEVTRLNGEVTRLTGELATANGDVAKAQADHAATKARMEQDANMRAISIIAAAGGSPIPGSVNPKPGLVGKAGDGLKGIDRVRAAFAQQIKDNNK